MSAERFKVYVNYGKDKPNVLSSQFLTFAEATEYRDVAKEQRTKSYGIILVDTQRQLVEVSLGKMEDFKEVVAGFTQVDVMTDD